MLSTTSEPGAASAATPNSRPTFAMWGLRAGTLFCQILACTLSFTWITAQPVRPDPPAQAVASPTGEYLIGPGDTLQVFVWRQPDLSTTVPVRPDGMISTPLAEDIVAVGQTPTQLARRIEQVLAEYIRSPQVNVIVQNFVGIAGAQVRVLGAVMQPRAVPYREQMTLLDAIIEVGGLTNFAAGNRARLVRTAEGRSEGIRVRLEDLVKKGELDKNIPLRSGDVIIVPEAVF